jgi:alanyl-tRNA synthetase
MATLKTYLADSTILRTNAEVTLTGTAPDGRSWIRLDRTIFHPQGGGQKADRGRIGGVEVLHVAHGVDGEVDHFIAAPAYPVGSQVELQVDPVWRGVCARLHSAGHLIAAISERFADLRAIAGHHWPGEARVDFEIPDVWSENLQNTLSEALVRVMSSDLEVAEVGDPYSARAIRIGDFEAVPCGGTHVRRISEIGRVTITKVRLKEARVRLSYAVDAAQLAAG